MPSAGILYQSVDVLRAFLDDPWLMGRVAVLHALSDLHAMGATPHSVLAQITLPYAARHMQAADLFAILAGACQELEREGAILLGGHTLEGPELSVGFTVNGLAETGVMAKTAIADGDQLVLCKPLGTGVLFAAQQHGLSRGSWISAALENMLISNAAAAAVARNYEVKAATDVTGFGLLGHLAEMLVDTNLQARIDSNSVPLLAGVEACYSQGLASTLQPGNITLVEPLLSDASSVTAPQLQPLFDPQTSGGLLLAVSPAKVTDLLAELNSCGYKDASIIGEIGRWEQPGSLLVS
jgi:selenide,water dikinase